MEIRHKTKPLNRKAVIQRLILSVAMGILFGFALVTTVILLGPSWKSVLGLEDKDRLVIQVADEAPGNTNNNSNEKSSGQALEQNSKLYSELYKTGNKELNCLVEIDSSAHEAYTGEMNSADIGCGIIMTQNSKDLYVLTTPKAVRGKGKVLVSFCTGQTVEGKVRAKDGETGIAIIRVGINLLDKDTKKAIRVARIGNSDTLERGQYAIVVGNPLGEFRTTVVGQFVSVNSKLRYADREYTLLETDCQGKHYMQGFLLNKNGRVVGIIDHNSDETGESLMIKGVGITDLTVLIERLSNQEPIPYMGVEISSISSEKARLYNIPEGVFVEYAYMGSPAVEAGIQKGDIIIGIGKNEVTVAKYFSEILSDISPGTTIKVRFKRFTNGKYKNMTANVTIGKLEIK